jgi:hypothetical protein
LGGIVSQIMENSKTGRNVTVGSTNRVNPRV